MNTTDREITVPRGTLYGTFHLISSPSDFKQGHVMAIMPEESLKTEPLVPEHQSWSLEQKRDFIVEHFDLSSPLLDDPQMKTLAVNLLIQFFDVISVAGEFGKTNLIEHAIDTGDAPPIRCKQAPIPPTLNDSLRKQLSTWLQQGVITKSSSPFSFRCFGVPKKPNTIRWVIDYRKLNSVTLKDSFPIPNVSDTLNRLSNSCIFTTLDMSGAFHCVPTFMLP